jgi:hypothetical protein
MQNLQSIVLICLSFGVIGIQDTKGAINKQLMLDKMNNEIIPFLIVWGCLIL